jgi:hypothetical protein
VTAAEGETETERDGDDRASDGRPDGNTADRSRNGRFEETLEGVRTEPRTHALAAIAVVIVGLALAWLHWFGLVLAGALVGLISPTIWRGLAGALGFGVLVLVAFAIGLGDSTWRVLEMTPVVYVVVASALGLPAFGALVRGVI